jgi:hypothetical protein
MKRVSPEELGRLLSDEVRARVYRKCQRLAKMLARGEAPKDVDIILKRGRLSDECQKEKCLAWSNGCTFVLLAEDLAKGFGGRK